MDNIIEADISTKSLWPTHRKYSNLARATMFLDDIWQSLGAVAPSAGRTQSRARHVRGTIWSCLSQSQRGARKTGPNEAGQYTSQRGLIDIQINGAYGFDFSVFDGDEQAYKDGLASVAEKIVETGVTSYVYRSSQWTSANTSTD